MIRGLKINALPRARILVALIAFVCATIPSAEAQIRPITVPQFEVAAEYSYIRANRQHEWRIQSERRVWIVYLQH